jgi:hypothetical protein
MRAQITDVDLVRLTRTEGPSGATVGLLRFNGRFLRGGVSLRALILGWLHDWVQLDYDVR